MNADVEQAKIELAVEKSHMFALLEELEELRLTTQIQKEHRFRAKQKQ